MNKNIAFLIILLFLTPSHSSAGILVEPYLGFTLYGKTDSGSPPDNIHSISGPGYGARLGYTFLAAQLGIDYYKGILKESGTGPKGTQGNFDISDLGLYAGFDVPALLRIYIILVVQGDVRDNESNKLVSPEGFRLGAGFSVAPKVMVNFEYRNVKYNKQDLSTGDSVSRNPPYTSESIMAYISAPFIF